MNYVAQSTAFKLSPEKFFFLQTNITVTAHPRPSCF